MKNKNSKLAIIIAIAFEILLVITFIPSAFSGQWKNLFIPALAMAGILAPFIITYIANRKDIVLPRSFQLLFLIFILLAQYFGETLKFYVKFSWWDLFLHGVFGILAVIFAMHLIQGIITKEKKITKKRFITFTLIFAFCFSVTLGTLWELLEFLVDYFFKTDMVNGGLEDTMSDLNIKTLCSFITCIVYYFHKMRK